MGCGGVMPVACWVFEAPRGPESEGPVDLCRVRLPEAAAPAGKGVRAARTIYQWQIVRPERTAHKRGAGGA